MPKRNRSRRPKGTRAHHKGRKRYEPGNGRALSVIRTNYHWTANNPTRPHPKILTHKTFAVLSQNRDFIPHYYPWPFYRLVA